MKNIFAAAAAATIAFAAMPASATVFDFTANNNNSSSWTKDGLTVTVSGWSTTSTAASSLPSSGTATAWLGNGYGVMNASTDGSHTVDNAGYYDFLRLEFSKAVTLGEVSLKAFGDTDAWVSYGSTATNMTSTNGWATFVSKGSDFMGGTSDRSFAPGMTTASNVWLIGAGRSAAAGGNDQFKVSSINVTAAVPEPATWAMMMVGFGMVGAAARRRRAAANVSFA